MPDYYNPDLGGDPDNPFARREDGSLARPDFWRAMSDRSVVLAMTQGVGMPLTADQKRAHLADIGREHLIDEVCAPEIIPPER